MKPSEITDTTFDAIKRPVLYVPGAMTLATTLVRHPDTGNIVSGFGDHTLEALAEEYPEGIITSLEAAAEKIQGVQHRHYVKPWEETDKDQFMEMLEVLPPERWETCRGVNFFSMCEYLIGDLTRFYARLNGRYFTAVRCGDTPSLAIAHEVGAASMAA